jgi:large subunit ribosomal protein L6
VKTKFSRKNNKINFLGPSWPAVSATAAEVHHLKKPDVYNGKGVRYRGLKLRKKEGKKQSR